jgi:hypothetical protein
MFNGNFITVDSIFEAVNTELKGLNIPLDPAEGVEWIGETLEKIGVPGQLVDKITNGDKSLGFPNSIIIKDYKGELPIDLYYVVSVIDCGTKAAMKRLTDINYMAYHCAKYQTNCNSSKSYKVNNNFIFTNFKEGEIMMNYKAIPLDDKGYPLIPDNRMVKEAVKYGIISKLAQRMWLQDRFTAGKFQHFEREYLFYVNAAETSMRVPTYDEAENWKNMFQSLIPDTNAHSSGFRHIGDQERRFNSNQDF